MSHDAPVSARYIYDPIALHDAGLRFTTVERIRYGASKVQAGSATTFSSCCVLDESVDRNVSDTPIHPECPYVATITPTSNMSPVPLR